MTGLIDVTAITSAAATIGAAGSAAVGSTNGGNGGNTAITLGGTTYTWGGGSGSIGNAGQSSALFIGSPGGGGTGTNLATGQSFHGLPGIGSSSSDHATGGHGGYTNFGGGGYATPVFSTGIGIGQAGFAYGGGAAGPAVLRSSSTQNGYAGAAGAMRFWEFY